MTVVTSISQIQRLLVESEGYVKDARDALRKASRAQTVLHESAAALLAEHGAAIGAGPDVVAAIITPKDPRE